jgi:hypothetical protein
MKASNKVYKLFVVDKIFDYTSGTGITKEEIENNPGCLNAVQSGEGNNGILGKISLEYVKTKKYKYTEKACLTVARTGSSGFVSFQPDGCVVGDSAKYLLLPEDIASTNIYLYLQTILTKNRFKYAYGRKVTEDNYFSDFISLPIKTSSSGMPYIDETKRFSEDGFIPDWSYMDSYISMLHHRPITTVNVGNSSPEVKLDTWKQFRFGNLIEEPYKAHAYTKEDLDRVTDETSETIPYITRTAENNGCEFRTSVEGLDYIEEGNAISIGDTTATFFYQSERFIAGDHMVIIRADWLNKWTALFILSVLEKERYKYSYGRAFVKEKVEDTILILPILCNRDGTPQIDETCEYSPEGYIPDWSFMEEYIKSLPYGDRI